MNPLLLALLGGSAGASFLSNFSQASNAQGMAQANFTNQTAAGRALAEALGNIDVGVLNNIFGVAKDQRSLVRSGISATLPQAARVTNAANVFNQGAFRDLIGNFLGPDTLTNLSENINTAIKGLPSQSTLDMINQTRAQRGVQSGVPLRSELGANALATSLGRTVEQTQQQGLQNFLAFQSALPQPVRFEQTFGALMPYNTPSFGQTLQNAQFNEQQRIGLATGQAQALASIPAVPQYTPNPFTAGLFGAGSAALGAGATYAANAYSQNQFQNSPAYQQQQLLNYQLMQQLGLGGNFGQIPGFNGQYNF